MSMVSATPTLAQVDLSGVWGQKQHEDRLERGPGPTVGDYTGLPINDAARLRGDTWDASKWSVLEHQCDPHPADYAPFGPAHMRIQPEIDPISQAVTAWHTTMNFMLPERTIWMDGRPHPPEDAAHTWQGFSTGHWEGDMLVVTTTHLKEGWIRRNGIPSSDRRTLTEYWIRQNDHITLVSIVDDPAYLAEPMIRTVNWILNNGYNMLGTKCIPRVEVAQRLAGNVAHRLPGENPYLREFAEAHRLPLEAVRGGVDTIYPEYEQRLRELLGRETGR
jgi:hypothetical protein